MVFVTGGSRGSCCADDKDQYPCSVVKTGLAGDHTLLTVGGGDPVACRWHQQEASGEAYDSGYTERKCAEC